jgi:hypothetical protein
LPVDLALHPRPHFREGAVHDERQFRATTDQMLQMIDRLRAVELDKQASTLGSPEFIAHAEEAERLSRMVFRWAGMQLQMAESSAGAVQRGEMSREPLTSVEPRPLDRILANWREAQLRFEIAKPGSPEAAAAAEQVERLREEFHAVQDAKLSREVDWAR